MSELKYRVLKYILFDNEVAAKVNIETGEVTLIDAQIISSWDDTPDIDSQLEQLNKK